MLHFPFRNLVSILWYTPDQWRSTSQKRPRALGTTFGGWWPLRRLRTSSCCSSCWTPFYWWWRCVFYVLPSLCSMPAGTSCMPAVVVRWSLVCCQTDVRKGIWINSVWGFGISKQLFGDLQAFGVSEIRIHGGNQRWMTLVPHNSSKEAYMIWLPYFFTVPRCTLGLHWRLGGLQSRFYHSFHHRMCDEIEFLWIQGKFEFWLIPLAYLYINLSLSF